MSGTTIRAVIFDWGGTITPWHSGIDWAEPYRRAARLLHPDDAARAAILAEALSAAESSLWARTQDGQVSATLADVFGACGVAEYEQACEPLFEFWEPHTYTDPDAPALLAALRNRNIRVGLLSNTIWPRSRHDGWLARDGVLGLFDATVYSSELPWVKPHPEAFYAAMAAVGVSDAREAVFVGDRPYDDIHGAKAVGMRAVLLPHSTIPAAQRGPVDGEPDGVINRLADLLPLIDGWTR